MTDLRATCSSPLAIRSIAAILLAGAGALGLVAAAPIAPTQAADGHARSGDARSHESTQHAPRNGADPSTAANPGSAVDALVARWPQRKGVISGRGNPLTLQGATVAVGDTMPDCIVVDGDMQDRALSEWTGKTIVLTTLPSVDTGVCAAQMRAFNERAAALGDDVVILVVSMDLPFAQKRFCAAEGIERVVTLSDFRHWSVAQHFGLRVVETGFLARAAYVIDPKGTIRHAEIVPELTQEPDYAAVMRAIEAVR